MSTKPIKVFFVLNIINKIKYNNDNYFLPINTDKYNTNINIK